MTLSSSTALVLGLRPHEKNPAVPFLNPFRSFKPASLSVKDLLFFIGLLLFCS